MSSLFDSDVPLKDITEGLDQNTESSEGSRESNPSDSSPSKAAYYNGFNSKRRYV